MSAPHTVVEPETPAPTPEPTPTPVEVTPQRWQDQYLDADLRQAPALGDFKSVRDLAKSYVEARDKISQKGLILPKPDAPPEAWNEIYQALGRPEAPEQYDLGDWKAPEGLPWDPEFQNEALKRGHELGFTSKQMAGLLAWYAEKARGEFTTISQAEEQITQHFAEETERRWGRAKEEKLDLAERGFQTAFPESSWEAISEARLPGGGKLTDHPDFLDGMARVGAMLAEHGLLGDKQPTRYAKTPGEAAAEIQRLRRDPEFLKRFAAGDPDARAQLRTLTEQEIENPHGAAEHSIMTR